MADMSRQSLVDDFKASLHDAAQFFNASADADFLRLLDTAAAEYSRDHLRLRRDHLTLTVADIDYPAPADIIRVHRCDWGRQNNRAAKYWDSNFIRDLPTLRVINDVTDGKKLELSRNITAAELASIGADCVYYYEAAHLIAADAADTTIEPHDRGLLILRAQAEACAELAMRSVGKPVQLRDGISGTPRNGTPAALAEFLLKQYTDRGRRR